MPARLPIVFEDDNSAEQLGRCRARQERLYVVVE